MPEPFSLPSPLTELVFRDATVRAKVSLGYARGGEPEHQDRPRILRGDRVIAPHVIDLARRHGASCSSNRPPENLTARPRTRICGYRRSRITSHGLFNTVYDINYSLIPLNSIEEIRRSAKIVLSRTQPCAHFNAQTPLSEFCDDPAVTPRAAYSFAGFQLPSSWQPESSTFRFTLFPRAICA